MFTLLLSPVHPAVILWPLMGHVGLVVVLYAWLTVARTRAVKAGEVTYGVFEFGRDEPAGIARITRNLSNQFELPVLFYVGVILLIEFQATTIIDVAYAWLFLVGRLIHSAVQTLTDDVPLRGRVFMINFIGVAGLLGHVALVTLRQ